jgi:hypothetical protein
MLRLKDKMLNNKRGNIMLGLTIGLFIFIFGILFISFFLDDITTARSNLQCSSPSSITSGTMIVCLMTDGVVPLLIWGICSVTIGYFLGGGI